jgi:cell division protein FtsQ
LLAAGLVGAVIFAAATGFGRHVRHVDALPAEIDRLLVAAGFGINEVSLSGHHHTLDKDVFAALAAGRSTLLFLDVRAARRRIETLPWVETATVTRIFPDKLKVELRERRPVAVWLDGDRKALLDAEGRVLSYVATFVPPGLPQIAGPGAPEAAAELRAALQRFPTVAPRVRLSRRIGARRWDLELTNGATVRLAAGPPTVSLDRLVKLEEETQGLDHGGQIIDLTVPHSIAVSAPVDAARDATAVRPGSARQRL